MQNLLFCVLTGAVGGVVAALCGVGGGIIMVPAFVFFFGLEQKQAVATSLAAIILTALLASIKNAGHGFVNWKIAVPTAISAAVVAWFAADGLRVLSNLTLTRIFAVVMIALGTRMLWVAR
jgi:uncharacterized membrane protein YfcA